MTSIVAFVALACVGLAAGAGFFAWCCCACTTPMNITVRRLCGLTAISGATVEIKVGGVTIASGTTDGSGVAWLYPVAPTGTAATIVVSVAITGYDATTTANATLRCSTIVTTITVNVASGYSCIDDPCCPRGGSAPYLERTYPTTVYVDDAFGTVTLTRLVETGIAYEGCATRESNSLISGCGTESQSAGTGDTECHYRLACSGSSWTLSVTMPICPGPGGADIGPIDASCDTTPQNGYVGFCSGTCGETFAMTADFGTGPRTSAFSFDSVFGTGAVTMAISS